MFGFSSYHWPVEKLSPHDRHAVDVLNSASPELPTAGYATHDPDGLFGAYRTLLHSTDVRARGVALDQYAYAEAQGRWSVENPLTLFDDAVRAEARAMLAVPARPGVPLDDQPDVVSGWLSALGVLTHLADGDTTDLPRIMAVIDALAADDMLDVTAFWAVEVRLDDADAATHARIGAWFAGMAADERLPVEVRVQAVRALGDDRTGHRDAVAGLLDHPELRLSIEAAQRLLELDRSAEPQVRRVVAGWPDDAPYPASDVRYRLQEADELARARAALAAPAAGTVTGALETVAEHGSAADLPGVLAVLDDDGPATEVDDDAFARAAVHCLRTADGSAAGRAYDALAAVYSDPGRPVPVRVLALRPFWRRPEHRIDDAAVTALLSHDDVRLSAAAALAAVDRPGSEGPVRAAAARWPADAPEPASRLREVLAEYDELAAARAVLAAPVDVPGLVAAVRTVTYDGDDTDAARLLALLEGEGLAAVFAATDRATELELAWKLRRALLRYRDDDPRHAAALSRLESRLAGSS